MLLNRLFHTTIALSLVIWLAPAATAQEKRDPEHDHEADTPHAHDHENPHAIAWAGSFKEALAAAEKAQKPVMVDFGAEWCGWCKKLDRDTFQHEQVIRFVRQHFIAVKVDTDKTPDVSKTYSVSGLPTILFLSPAGKELLRIRGYRAPDKFLEEAKKPANSSATLTQLKKAAADAPDDVDAQRAYARALLAAGGGEEALGVLQAALKKAPDHVGLLLDLADTQNVGKKYAEARAVYEKILALPADKAGEQKARAYLPLGRILIRLREHQTAVEVIGKYLDTAAKEKQDSKERWEAHFIRGFAYAVLKDAKHALADLETVRDESPDSTWGLRANYIIEVVKAE